MEDFVLTSYVHFGPLAVFVLLLLSGFGIPLGEDFIIIPAGVLVAAGTMPLGLTAAAVYLGVVIADFTWFGIISRYGTLLLHKKWIRRMIHPRRLLQAKHQMDRHGAWMIVFARFIPGSRSSAITVAAMLHMPFWKFATATVPSVLVTAALQLGLGMLIYKGVGTEDTARLIVLIIGLIVLLVAVLLLVGLVGKVRQSKQGPPRAKAKWLRKFQQRRRRKKAASTMHSSRRTTNRRPAPTTPDQWR